MAKVAARFKAVVVLFLTHCFLLYIVAPLFSGGSVFGPCFIMQYLVSFLVLQST